MSDPPAEIESEPAGEPGPSETRTIKPRAITPVAQDDQRHATRRVSKWLRSGAAMVGLRPRVVVDGVRYRECTPESLRRALAPRGRGWKEYDVRFPRAKGMRIRAQPTRVYADIAGPVRTRVYERLSRDVRPGERVLDLCAGTGDGAASLAKRVGPSGAVVALETDHESIRFARRRHAHPNAAFEFGAIDALQGELDHSFDTLVVVDPPLAIDEDDADVRAGDEERAVAWLADLWRLVAPNGRLAIAAAEPGDTPPPVLWRPNNTLPAGELDRLIERACGVDASNPSIVDVAELSGRSLRIVTRHRPESRPVGNAPPSTPPHG
ncbi:MAG: methyltransferase domain-containing protein [Planctomycetota bacterium]